MFPQFFVDNDPLYASVFLTDLGSLGHGPGVPPPLRVRDDRHLRCRSAGRAPSRSRDPNTGRHGAQAHRHAPLELRRAHRGRPVRGLRAQAHEEARRGPGEGRHRRRRRRHARGARRADSTSPRRRAGHRRRSVDGPGVAAAPSRRPGSPRRTTSRPAAGAAVLARGGNAIDAIVARQPRARRRRAVPTAATAATSSRSSGTASSTATSAPAGRRRPRRIDAVRDAARRRRRC